MTLIQFERVEIVDRYGRRMVESCGVMSVRLDEIVEVGTGPHNPESYHEGKQHVPERFATIRMRGDSERVLVYCSQAVAHQRWLEALEASPATAG